MAVHHQNGFWEMNSIVIRYPTELRGSDPIVPAITEYLGSSQYKNAVLPRMGIPIIKIRRSWPSYLYNGNPHSCKGRLHTETGPRMTSPIECYMMVDCLSCCKHIATWVVVVRHNDQQPQKLQNFMTWEQFPHCSVHYGGIHWWIHITKCR